MTKIDLIVDRSSSMAELLKPTISGIREFVDIQKKAEGSDTTTISLTTFDDKVEQPVKDVPIHEFEFDEFLIAPRGMTALYDAIGKQLENMPFNIPRIVVIITDGQDNSSRLFNPTAISAQITERRKHGWTFIFLAANQDAIAAGRTLSIPAETSCTFDCEEEGATMCAIRAASNAISRGQTSGEVIAFTQVEREESSGKSVPLATQEDDDEEGLDKCASVLLPLPTRATNIPRRGATGY
jgi:uncharacterized protein YegL